MLAYDRVLKKCFGGPGKVLEFLVSERVGSVLRERLVCDGCCAVDRWRLLRQAVRRRYHQQLLCCGQMAAAEAGSEEALSSAAVVLWTDGGC